MVGYKNKDISFYSNIILLTRRTFESEKTTEPFLFNDSGMDLCPSTWTLVKTGHNYNLKDPKVPYKTL